MLKYNVAIVTGLASLFVLPAALGQQDVDKLHAALNEISHAIDVMTGIERKVQELPDEGIDLVLAATEAPHLEQRALGDRLGSLRKEVSLLQMELDALDSPSSAMTLQSFVPSGPAASSRQGKPSIPSPVSTGLDDSLRASISNREPRGREQRTGRPSSLPSTNPVTDASRPAPEFEGYTADPLGQARACYRVGRYQQGLDLLGELEDSAALYWKARCLERLERIDEAIELLTRVMADEADSYQGQRASKDLEFLRWKKAFLQKLPTGMQDTRSEG